MACISIIKSRDYAFMKDIVLFDLKTYDYRVYIFFQTQIIFNLLVFKLNYILEFISKKTFLTAFIVSQTYSIIYLLHFDHLKTFSKIYIMQKIKKKLLLRAFSKS